MDTQHTQDSLEEGAQRFRIERGAQVLGTDGPLGTVQQVVMDQEAGTLRSLVVRGEAGMDYELDAGHIESATGDEVRLDIGRQDLASQPSLARPYVPEQYAAVESGQVMPPGQAADVARQEEGPVLTNIEPDAVEVVAPTDAEWDAVEAADDLNDLDDFDDADELEAVIIPGEHPGETDIFIAGAAEQPGTGGSIAATEGAWLPTRGPQGADYQGPGGRSMAGILGATGVLLLTGGAIAAYLIVRRNQQQATVGAWVRQQTAASTANAAALRDTLRDTLRDRANVWLPAAAGSLAALRAQATARGGTLTRSLRRQARQASEATKDAASRTVGPVGTARQTAGQVQRNIQQQLQNGVWWQWLRDMPGQSAATWNDLSRRLSRATKQATKQTTKQVTQATRANAATMRANAEQARRAAAEASKQASKRMQEARANAQRNARRMRRRARWFRNGLLAGVAGGILYAPRPGLDTRATLADWLRRIPGLDTLLDSYAGRSAMVGGTGPHPQTPLAPDARAAWGTTPANLGTTSEQPGGLPLTPDLTPGDMPGPAL